MAQELISVIVPVYNAEQYLEQCIDSILGQTYHNFELILIDDGSCDSSGALCDQYALADSRITVIHQSNSGQAAARNRGIAAARAAWISFVDSDDVIHPDMLADLYAASKKTSAPIITCGFTGGETVPDTFFLGQHYAFREMQINDDVMAEYERSSIHYSCVCGALIYKPIAQKLPFAEGRIYEDNAIMVQWLFEAKRIAESETPYYFYRVNPHGTTKSGYSLKQLDILWSRRVILEFYERVSYPKILRITCGGYFKLSRWQFNELAGHGYGKSLQRKVKREAAAIYRRYKKHLGPEEKRIYAQNWRPRFYFISRMFKR